VLTVGEVIDSRSNATCSTASVRGLSLQIIAEMNLIVPNALVNFEDLNVSLNTQVVNPFLQPAAKEALRRAIQEQGETLMINSAYRTVVQQHLLSTWRKRGQCGIPKAANPGLSNHEDGLALDVQDFSRWRGSLESTGWEWLGPDDEFHFTFIGGGVRDDIGDIGVSTFQQLWNKHNPDSQVVVDGIFGDQTAIRMDQSPAQGFAIARIIRETDPPMQGDNVRKVQQALVNAGFLGADAINGIYDSVTADAVAKFQVQMGLKADRIVGLRTRRKLGIP
jgi:hypothetical protein